MLRCIKRCWLWCKHAFCWVAATHCATGSPGPCRASCSPAKCGWAHQSPCSPSSPRAGTRLTEALDITEANMQFTSAHPKALQIHFVWVLWNGWELTLWNVQITILQSANTPAWLSICPNTTLWITAGWSEMETLAEKSQSGFQRQRADWTEARGQCLSVSLINKITQTGAGNDPHMLLMSCSRPLAALQSFWRSHSDMQGAILFYRGRITRSSISNVLMLKHSWTENQHQVTVKTCQKCAGYLPAFSLWKHTENYREEFGLNLMHVWMKLICPDRCRKWVVCFPTNKLEGEYLSALQLQSAFPCTCSLWLSCLAF